MKAADGDRQQQLEGATGSEGLFAFINYNLGSGSEAVEKLREAGVYSADARSQQQQQLSGGAAALASAAAAAAGSGSSNSSNRHNQKQRQQVPDRRNLIGSVDGVTAAKVGLLMECFL
jgi:hypothetical protein